MPGDNHRMKQLTFVSIKPDRRRTHLFFVESIERGLERGGLRRVPNQPFGAFVFGARCLQKARLVRNLVRLPGRAVVVPIMNLAEHRMFPQTYLWETIPWIFDCWPRRWDEWERFFRRHHTRVAFISARQSMEHFQQRLPQVDFHWMPESVEPGEYERGEPLAQRDIDVLEMGRRHNPFHDSITGPLASAGKVHLYEKVKGQLIFASYGDFIHGLARAKISVCFPGCITHRDWSGHVETVTYRYFESMASRCLVVGHCPAELRDLFGYDPIIAAHPSDAATQVLDVLARIEEYQSLVDRNYQRLLEVGTWDARVRQIVSILQERGYRTPRPQELGHPHEPEKSATSQ